MFLFLHAIQSVIKIIKYLVLYNTMLNSDILLDDNGHVTSNKKFYLSRVHSVFVPCYALSVFNKSNEPYRQKNS